MDGRSDEARTSHTQTLEMGPGPGTGLDWQTSEQLLEPDVGDTCACDGCAYECNLHSTVQHVVEGAPMLLCCSAGWLNEARHRQHSRQEKVTSTMSSPSTPTHTHRRIHRHTHAYTHAYASSSQMTGEA